MNLEDNLGDVIRKARAMSNISAPDAAKAAGLTEAELNALEDTGTVVKQPNFPALAALLGLNATKLETIAKGWAPKKQDLSKWCEFRQITTTKDYAVNCYLVWDEISREAALFDTGWDATPALKIIEEEKLQLKHFFITHTHEDHIAGMDAVRAKFPNVRIHTSAKSAPPQQRLRNNDCIHLGSLRISNRETIGHAEDGVTYIIGNWSDDAPHVAIVGDAIFSGSMGKGNQSWDVARKQVREQILTLPPETLICPGHGPISTVGEEKANNPFF
ncbi:MAG: Transcriptional regulator, family [Verrucomicrobiales bacterium]|nr:Transcriptional regulator, family [Verrucomicrobiales bacterium]